MPCTMRRTRRLIKAGRVQKRDYRPFTIHLKDRSRDDGRTQVQPTEVRCTPGARRTGIAAVILLDGEDRIVYQEEIEHRTDISKRLNERKEHRRRRRGTKWYRPARFDNRTRGPKWVPPTIESIVSNQTHRLARLAERVGTVSTVVQTAKFDTQKILNPEIQGEEYQQGPLYQSHAREYVAAQWKHRCAYCGKGDWEDRTRFNLDHVVPRAHRGPDNVRNLVWSCRPCNERKADQAVAGFLQENPERLSRVLRQRPIPMASAGQHAAICETLLRRLEAAGLETSRTTGADTAVARRKAELEKTHANDAACCRSNGAVKRPRYVAGLKAVGHGRRKQIIVDPENAQITYEIRGGSDRCSTHASPHFASIRSRRKPRDTPAVP